MPGVTEPLAIQALGIQGFVLRHGGDSVMTAPLFTRQSGFEITINVPLPADTAAIDAGLANVDLSDLRAVISGHAHYDHFIDVPHILARAPTAVAYTNLTGKHILAALAPDRPASCTGPQPEVIARDRVIAVDEASPGYVDYTNCPDDRPGGAPLAGSWIAVPGSHVRLMPLCSMHPAQVGPYHFGAGSIDQDQCELLRAASGWLEGETIAYVIDFLDDSDRPVYRVFYQDAPTEAPVGHIPAALLAEKQVDVALLCVGSSNAVSDQPHAILANTAPRFALSGHWEDFFQPVGSTAPIPLLDVDDYVAKAEAALPGAPDVPLLVDGAPAAGRHILVMPGTRFSVPPAR
jgi:hypothetical protein